MSNDEMRMHREINELVEQRQEISEQIEEKKRECELLDKSIQSKKRDMSVLNNRIKDLKEEVRDLSWQRADKKMQLGDNHDDNDDNSQTDRKSQAINTRRREIEKYENMLDSLKQQYLSWYEYVEELRKWTSDKPPLMPETRMKAWERKKLPRDSEGNLVLESETGGDENHG